MMKVWSYCAADWRAATKTAGGVKPITCPPLSAEGLDLAPATRADIVYLNLHGYPNQPNYYGQADNVVGPTALTADMVMRYRWQGVVVFAEVCYSVQSKIARAFLDNGARAFIGSTTEAYGRIRPTLWDGEADRLMWLFRHIYPKAQSPAVALSRAKEWLKVLSVPLDADDRATIASFVCLPGEK